MKNSNTSSCLSGSELVDVVVGKAVTASFTFVACLATLILMCLLKVWRKFVYRLTMYIPDSRGNASFTCLCCSSSSCNFERRRSRGQEHRIGECV